MKSLIVKKTLWIYFWLKIWLPLFVLVGCATGDRLVFQPDVYINYTPHPYYYYYPRYRYGTFYLNYPIVVQNTSITNFIEIELNGKPLLPKRILPGKTESVNVLVEIGERRIVILTASCYAPSGKLTGTAYRELDLNIGPYEQPADIWPVYCRNP